MPHLLSMVDPARDGMRLDAFLATLEGAPSRSACAKLIEEGACTINSTLANDKSEHVALGDIIELDVASSPVETGFLEPNFDIPLDIRYEDDCLLVISKQAGLVCHPSPGHLDDTLANALVAHCGYGHLGMLQGEDRPGIVHRLDRDTTGLLLCAKTDACQQALQDLIRLRVLDRRYLTLVHGSMAADSGTIQTGIARSRRDPLRMCVSNDIDAREAITTYQTLERFEAGPADEGYSLLECHLYTGRTHQIRVHMRHSAHPLVGDPLYGRGTEKQNLGIARQFLHSWSIAFDHPMTGEHIALIDALPADLADALSLLASRSMGRTAEGERILGQICADAPHG